METAESKGQPQQFDGRTIAELVAAQKKSGLSVAAFAREHGVSVWRLYQAGRSKRKRKRRSKERRPEFVEVAVKSESPEAAPLELVLRSDLRVLVPAGFDEVTLRRLVGALASC